ncbi:Retrovirus-related Pol polyprotein LINE-1 [Gossypium australe]|uniref:Retrovirus-related Pol polyprotein LINE-1 n=1 Tax=Gossypium australe TaxID=47621 RepID=A0A5B6WZQ2_9ROSI|nr:Retrovirus-related Pol polyprotein LINE-1 [Gossypium australe]
MEWLGHSICKAIDMGNWSPIRLSYGGPSLSHLFFADDLILFGHADENQVRVVKSILDKFCDYLGHRINSRKTNIFFSKGVDNNFGERISNLFGFQKVTNLGHYLVVPLFHDKVTNSTLNFVVERVRNMLSSWEASQFSLAGRATLAQSVLLSIPSYFMQTMMVPKGVCDEIERIVRKFVWGVHNGSSKTALVSLDLMCRPKSHGGLGLIQLKDQNTSFMMKVGDGSWKLDLFSPWVPEEIINKIVSVPPPHPSSGLDRIIWEATLTSSFSLKSAYEKGREGTCNLKEWLWEIPWKYHSPHRIRFFIWLALKQRLFTNAERRLQCCQRHLRQAYSTTRSFCFLFRIFSRLDEEQSSEPLFFLGWNRLTMSLWDYLVAISSNKARSHLHHWPLPNSWVSLSTDGSVRFDEGFAADGGYVRDHNGEWIIGFAKHLGNCTILEAELWGILDELNLILDSIEAINVILEDSSEPSCSALVRKIHLILRKMEQ